jgi:hypothetical protein
MKQKIDKQQDNLVKKQSDWLSQVENLSDDKADRLNGGGSRGLIRYGRGLDGT